MRRSSQSPRAVPLENGPVICVKSSVRQTCALLDCGGPNVYASRFEHTRRAERRTARSIERRHLFGDLTRPLVRRLRVAVNNAVGVRGIESVGDLVDGADIRMVQ